jgi:hypothetical protein
MGNHFRFIQPVVGPAGVASNINFKFNKLDMKFNCIIDLLPFLCKAFKDVEDLLLLAALGLVNNLGLGKEYLEDLVPKEFLRDKQQGKGIGKVPEAPARVPQRPHNDSGAFRGF